MSVLHDLYKYFFNREVKDFRMAEINCRIFDKMRLPDCHVLTCCSFLVRNARIFISVVYQIILRFFKVKRKYFKHLWRGVKLRKKPNLKDDQTWSFLTYTFRPLISALIKKNLFIQHERIKFMNFTLAIRDDLWDSKSRSSRRIKLILN